ncbi:MAG: hypothetical protein QG640_398 [Patescibacteria group bacterium]|nr:hypothetical protein [Patescibacteria group bacterium]
MNYKKLFLFLVLFISFFVVGAKAQAGTVDLEGWAWSSNIGWISFSSNNPGLSATPAYGVTFSTTTGSSIGNFGGYAWSPNIGWISFDATDGTHPSATTDLTTGAVTGWAQATAGAGRTDGWDGWISMSGTNYETGPAYITGNRGITFDPATGIFKGHAWGDTNVGWLAFTSNIGVPYTPPKICQTNCGPNDNSSLTLTANGQNSVTIRANESNQVNVTIAWNVDNVNQVEIASNNWPEGTPGASIYKSQSLNSTGNAIANFTNVIATTTKVLQLSYWNIAENFSDTVSVSITLEPYRPLPPTISCLAVPANARLCNGSSTNTAVNATIKLFGMCNADQEPPVGALACEFYCPDGFRVVNNTCRRQGTIEER